MGVDFQQLRKHFAKGGSLVTLTNRIRHAHKFFKFGRDQFLVEHTPRCGNSFAKPRKDLLRGTKQDAGPKMFEAKQGTKTVSLAFCPVALSLGDENIISLRYKGSVRAPEQIQPEPKAQSAPAQMLASAPRARWSNLHPQSKPHQQDPKDPK